MRVEFGNSNESQNQMSLVLQRFLAGEHLSALSCLSDGVSPTSFNRIYKWLRDGTYTTNGVRYQFREYWSEQNEDGTRKKGAYKIRVLTGKTCYECGGSEESPRGYGDSSHCYTCDGSGFAPITQMELNL